MIKSILLVSPNADALPAFSQAIKKYSGIFSTKIAFAQCKNTNELASMIEMGRKADLIFINKQMEKPEVSILHAAFAKQAANAPVLVVLGLQELITSKIFAKDKVVFDAQMNKEYIFNCLRLYLEDAEREIDVRIFKEILISVIDVIHQNTGEKLTPYSISKSKAEHEVGDVSAIVAFFGEGIKGTLLISTGMKLLRHFSRKILFCEDKDLTTDSMLDVMGEISNQVLGVVRKAMAEYGYELNASMQVTVSGEEHTLHNSSNGHYYSLPFTMFNLAFNVIFCYDTYPIKLNSRPLARSEESRRLDVRLVNELSDHVQKIVASNTKLKVEFLGVSGHKSECYETDSLHLIHGRGTTGGFIFAIDISNEAAKEIVKKMMFCEENDVTPALIADSIGELVNQIQGAQKKSAERLGYEFQSIVHTSFTTKSKISYLLKNLGHYVRYSFKIEDKFVLTVCYGLDSTFAHEFFDISKQLKE